jgi:hypothetical protein
MNWMQILENAVEVGLAFSMTGQISQWSAMDPAAGDRAVKAWVETAGTASVDRLDTEFFEVLKSAVSPAEKIRIMRLYAYFKVVEFARFGEFRGFPQV